MYSTSKICYRITTGSADQVHEALTWCNQLGERLNSTQLRVKTLLAGYRNLALQAEGFFQAMDFGFLFNTQRKVFHIGYNVTSEKLDDNFYDLLASEARLGSLLAIAKRDVPQNHWLHLGRPMTSVVEHAHTALVERDHVRISHANTAHGKL